MHHIEILVTYIQYSIPALLAGWRLEVLTGGLAAGLLAFLLSTLPGLLGWWSFGKGKILICDNTNTEHRHMYATFYVKQIIGCRNDITGHFKVP